MLVSHPKKKIRSISGGVDAVCSGALAETITSVVLPLDDSADIRATGLTLEPLAWNWSHWPGRLDNRGRCPYPCRCLANMAHIRQSRPYSGLGVQMKVRKIISGVSLPLRLEAGGHRMPTPSQYCEKVSHEIDTLPSSKTHETLA